MWISGLLWGLGEISVLIKDTGHLEFHLSQLKMWEIHSARLAQRLGFYVSFFFLATMGLAVLELSSCQEWGSHGSTVGPLGF